MSVFDGSRNPNSGTTAAHQYPISRSFAITVLTALVVLVALRHVFGSASLSVGVK